jgi:hypothetical protein
MNGEGFNMKKQSLNIDRIALVRLTDNHYKSNLFNVEFDFTGTDNERGEKTFKLFSVSIRNRDGSLNVICRNLLPEEKKHSGQHFNTLEPNKKLRLNQRDWKKSCNKLLNFFRLELPEVKL